jgi:hypothetical protein
MTENISSLRDFCLSEMLFYNNISPLGLIIYGGKNLPNICVFETSQV